MATRHDFFALRGFMGLEKNSSITTLLFALAITSSSPFREFERRVKLGELPPRRDLPIVSLYAVFNFSGGDLLGCLFLP
jgi:hypothetical protein